MKFQFTPSKNRFWIGIAAALFSFTAYKNRDATHPHFLYGVTMQNHSGYDYIGEDFETTVHLIGYSQEYTRAEQYLTLIQSTDLCLIYSTD